MCTAIIYFTGWLWRFQCQLWWKQKLCTMLNQQWLRRNLIFFLWGISQVKINKISITQFLWSSWTADIKLALKESVICLQMSAEKIKLSFFVRPPSMIRQYIHLTSPEKSWATQFNYNTKKCKHHSLSSLYVCGQEDNVLRGNKSALTATSKGAVRGLLLLKAQECCC